MKTVKDIDWVKNVLVPRLTGYEVKYKYFEKGDFGSLSQVEINSDKIGAGIDFWSSGRLEIFVWDFRNKKELLNKLFFPEEQEGRDVVFDKLQSLLT